MQESALARRPAEPAQAYHAYQAVADHVRSVEELPLAFQPVFFGSFRCSAAAAWHLQLAVASRLYQALLGMKECCCRYFNPVQSEAFPAAYESDCNMVSHRLPLPGSLMADCFEI